MTSATQQPCSPVALTVTLHSSTASETRKLRTADDVIAADQWLKMSPTFELHCGERKYYTVVIVGFTNYYLYGAWSNLYAGRPDEEEEVLPWEPIPGSDTLRAYQVILMEQPKAFTQVKWFAGTDRHGVRPLELVAASGMTLAATMVFKAASAKLASALENKMSEQQYAQKRLAEIDYIQGPVQIQKLVSDKYHKQIWLLGDLHVNDPVCPTDARSDRTVPITEWLELLFRAYADRVIDFYFETEFVSTKASEFISKRQTELDVAEKKRMSVVRVRQTRQAATNYLEKIQRHFDACLQSDKRTCDYKSVRFHYVDPRTSFQELAELHSTINAIGYLYEQDCGADPLSCARTLRQAFDKMNDKDSRVQLFKVSKIDKQFQAIKDTPTRQQLLAAVNRMIDSRGPTADEVKDFDAFILHLESTPSTQNAQNIIRVFQSKVHSMLAAFLDAYALPRMFRSFNNGPVPELIVSYAGAAHDTNQFDVLVDDMKFKFTAPYPPRYSDVRGTNFQCLRVAELAPYFEFPFFIV